MSLSNLSPSLIKAIDTNFMVVDIHTRISEILAMMSRLWRSCSLDFNDCDNAILPQEWGQTCVLVKENDDLIGIFTQRDILKLTANGISIKKITLKEVIKQPIITLKESEFKDIFTVLAIFNQSKIRHLPVINNQGKPVGIITTNTIRRSLLPSNFITKLRYVQDIMSKEVIWANLTDSVLTLAKLMTENQVSCVVICEQLTREYLTPLGIVTERDIVQFQALEFDLSKTIASQVMSYPLLSIKPQDSVLFANEQMEEKRVRRLVVLGDNNELLGLVSQTSILRILNPTYMYGTIEILQDLVAERTRELEESNLQLKAEIKQKQEAEIALKNVQEKLLLLVEEKTAQLTETNQKLEQDIIQRQEVEHELQQQTKQLQTALNSLQNTQMQLIQTEKMSSLGQLIAGIAHEINNPINFIYGNINYAEEYITDLLNLLELYDKSYPNATPEIREKREDIDLDFIITDMKKLLESMKSGTERIRNLVISLRNFSHLDQADLRWININDPIENSLLILQNQLKIKGTPYQIEVIKNFAELEAMECYPGQITQVIMNILTNAIDALKESTLEQIALENTLTKPPKIEIIIQELPDNHIAIKIIDNGKGIKEEVKNRLFDPFFTTKPVGKGTGLGLSISYQLIVENHKGKLYCNSTMGAGTEFIIEIPKQQQKGS